MFVTGPNLFFLLLRMISEQIYISSNAFTGSLDGITSTSISHLEAADNNLDGTLPDELWGLPLGSLDLSFNGLTGGIPPGIGQLPLQRLFLNGNNNLKGSLPTEIGLLNVLIEFQASFCGLTGTIPSEIGQCVKLGGNVLCFVLHFIFG